MELLEGETLAERLRSGALPFPRSSASARKSRRRSMRRTHGASSIAT